LPGADAPYLVLDLDGTLVDASARNHAVYSAVCRGLGGQPLALGEYWALKRSRAGWDDILVRSGLAPEVRNRFVDEFIARIEDPGVLTLDTVFPGTKPALDDLSATYRLVLATLRRHRALLDEQLRTLGLGDRFAGIASRAAGSDDPAAEKAALIRDMLNGSGAAAVIGDTEVDVHAASLLGFTSIAVCSGMRDRAILEGAGATHIAGDIGDVGALLARVLPA